MATKDRKNQQQSSITNFVTASLDNVKQFIDNTADEVAKADAIGATRRLADQLIDGTRDTVELVAMSLEERDVVTAVRSLAGSVLDGARDLVNVVSEESQRIQLIETGSQIAQEGLDLIRRQVDITFDAGSKLTATVTDTLDGVTSNIEDNVNRVSRMMPFGTTEEPQKKPGTITRVEIEADKVAQGGGGGGATTEKADKAEKHAKK